MTQSDIPAPATLAWETDVHLVTHPLMPANFAKLLHGRIQSGFLGDLIEMEGE